MLLHVFLKCSINQIKSSTNSGLKTFSFNYLRRCTTNAVIKDGETMQSNRKFTPFQDEMKVRRTEAEKSVVVQVQSAESYKELLTFCSSIGAVKKMLHYSVGVEPMHFIIIEFISEQDAQAVLSASDFINEGSMVPVSSQFVWFRASSKKLQKIKAKSFALTVRDGTSTLSYNDVKERLLKSENVSDQMFTLHKLTKLNDVGTRLRFLTARQIETGIRGMFPSAEALPFGSSVNGFGKMGCDLDLVLKLSKIKSSNDSRLVFHCKAASGSERTTSQRNMEVFGDLLQLFLPGCVQVRRILQARVPIIKYYQQLTDVECDLSVSNMSGVHMSDFLYLMASLDDRVQPLVCTIRKWASEVGLTNSSPGRWISNFSLTLLVLSFLQKPLSSPPILPPLKTLISLAETKDIHLTEDGVNCTFLRDLNKFSFQTKNTESLESLLLEFFEYYSLFDFSKKSICLHEADIFPKPDHSAMYIINPLERGLNVSKNVSLEETEKFKTEVRSAAWLLQSQENKLDNNWGVIPLFNSRNKTKIPLNFSLYTKNDRLVEVKNLFKDESSQDEENHVIYRNEAVKSQVHGIKRYTKKQLKQLYNENERNTNR